MKKYIIKGGKKLAGEVKISGSKNVVLKALIAAFLTDEAVELTNVPLIADFYILLDVFRALGAQVEILDHKVRVTVKNITNTKIPLETGAKVRTATLLFAPLLLRAGEAIIPNPGGCRIGARPIERHIEGLEKMGAQINYNHDDGYFYAKADSLHGVDFSFHKNTHTGTEALILAGVLATGRTVLHNAAEEPEVDDLIKLLNSMGGQIRREEKRTIVIDGVKKLHGVSFRITPDRNEAVTFGIASALTGGNIIISDADIFPMDAFLKAFEEAGGAWEKVDRGERFYMKNGVQPVDITTLPHPGFMTDWQGPWSVLMTQAEGESTIHETIYENRFSYVKELEKMGANVKLFNPKVENPVALYNFNYDSAQNYKQGLKIIGKTPLHNAVFTIEDLRAGATLVLASLIAKGPSVIYGVEQIERGYERFDERLRDLGADIEVVEEDKYE